MTLINEVAPPGFGHTKGDKEKGVKKGGTAAAFDKARKEGRFKGSKSDMFAIMWSQKKKGDKPHYKPGTDKKYKKYQEESTMPNVDSKDRKVIKARAKNLFKRDLKGEHQGVNETVKDPTKKKPKAPQFNAAKELVTDAPYMKPALQQREGTSYKSFMADVQSAKDRLKKKVEDRKKKDAQFVDAIVSAVKKKKEEKKPEKAMDAGAKARRMLKRREHAKYVSGSEDNVPDDLRDHKNWDDFKKHI